MNSYQMGSFESYINPYDLLPEEVEYELKIRCLPIGGTVQEKRLRFKKAQLDEIRNPKTLRAKKSIQQEYHTIKPIVQDIKHVLETYPEPRLISRLRHYRMRIMRSNTTTRKQRRMQHELLEDVENLLDRYGNPEDRHGRETRPDPYMYYSEETEKEEKNRESVREEPESETVYYPTTESRTGTIPKATKRTPDANAIDVQPELGAQSLAMMHSEGFQMHQGTLSDDQPSDDRNMRQTNVRMENLTASTPYRQEPLLPRRREECQTVGLDSSSIQMEKFKDEINQYIQQALSQQMSTLMSRIEPLLNQRQAMTPPPPPPTPPSTHEFRRNERYSNSVASRVSDAEDVGVPVPHRSLSGVNHHRWQVPANKWRICFSGDNRGPTVTQFLNRVEILARNNNVNEQELLSQANFFFKEGSEAEEWYYTFCQKFNSWTTFKHQLRLRFEQPNKDSVIERQILDRRQLQHETFNAFLTAIEKLAQQLTKSMPEARKLEILMENMKDCYKPFLTIYRIERIEDLVAICHSLDRSMYRSYTSYPRNRPHQVNMLEDSEGDEEQENSGEDELNAISQAINRKRFTEKPQKEQTKGTENRRPTQSGENEDNILCWNCRQFGHFWRNCSKPKKVFCHFCGNMNYVVSNCPGNHRFDSSENENTGRS